jgi:3'-5' exoribonuclease
MFEGIKEGDVISAVVMIKSISKHKTKSQNDYLRLTVNDGHNDVTAFIWDASVCVFKVGDVVKLKGTYGRFDDKDKLDVISIDKTTQRLKLPTLSDKEIDGCVTQLRSFVKKVEDKDFNSLINLILDSVWDDFISAPAATGNHHAYIGGLIQHTVNVTKLALTMSDTVSEHVNKSLLIVGCILHDIGKIKEYEYEKVIDRTTSGKLLGHTSLGIMIISRLLPNDFPIKKSTELFHLILSHHGKREWGAPIEPLMKEAVLIHQSDMVDSYSGRFDKIKSENKVDDTWSQWDNKYNRSWYLASMTD